MAGALPEGLIKTNEGFAGTIESVDHVDEEDIARLWKAYRANRAVLADDVGRRLEYFFWRIWSNRRLLDDMSGALIAANFSKISEGGYIRTTPTQSPRPSQHLRMKNGPHWRDNSFRPQLPSSLSRSEDSYDGDEGGDAEETETEAYSSSKKKLPSRPPPILKQSRKVTPPRIDRDLLLSSQPRRPSAAHSHGDPMSGDETPTQAAKMHATPSERSTKTARFTAEEASLISSSDLKTKENGADESKGKQKQSRRKAAVVASTSSSKRRPIMRQRLPQTSPSIASTASPSHLQSKPLLDDRIREESLAHDLRKIRGSGSERMSSDGDEGISEEQIDTEQTKSRHAADRGRLAYPGSMFKSGIQPLSGHISSRSLLKKSTAAAAASASYQASGIMNVGSRTKAGQSRGVDAEASSETYLASAAGASRRKNTDSQASPRSKSQLTLLLHRDRKQGNDR
ncbi:MAG: hypothetical protein Q9173_004475 [Seirophora scorigena]